MADDEVWAEELRRRSAMRWKGRGVIAACFGLLAAAWWGFGLAGCGAVLLVVFVFQCVWYGPSNC